jgi:hypothetical protein
MTVVRSGEKHHYSTTFTFNILDCRNSRHKLERLEGIEPSSPGWKPSIINHYTIDAWPVLSLVSRHHEGLFKAYELPDVAELVIYYLATVTGLEPASTHGQCVSLTRCLHGQVNPNGQVE